MTTIIPNTQASGVEAYEDMFKEITKKLYGEEASQSLHTPMAHINPDVERSFTNLLSDRNLATNDFDHGAGIDNAGSLKSDDHLTAFGLAALMQNGFATPNALLNSHTFQQMNKQNQTNSSTSNTLSTSAGNLNTAPSHNNANETVQDKCSPLQHGNELNAWSKSDAYQHASKHFKSKKHEVSNHHASNESLKSTTALNSNGNNAHQTPNGNIQSGLPKRYNCSNCPYSTDRRDLFTRHENIHKEDKPFHCYVCLKQFNRADHVKKHFLRMHRGLNYDIGRTKRSLPQTKSKKSTSSGTPYYNHTGNTHQATNLSIPTTYHPSLPNQHHQQMESSSQASIIDQTNQHLSNTFHSNAANTTNQPNQSHVNIKVEKRLDKPVKKGDKRFVCCYCSWSGNDNWGLKRHLNTHTKPFVCVLCDYKAARSERLATHVFKVHNKKVCTKCNYLAENQNEYDTHVNDTHANETRTQRNNQTESRSPTNNPVRNVNSNFGASNTFNTLPAATSSSPAFGNWRSMIGGTGASTPSAPKSNGSTGNSNQKRGAERLFQYFEADDSDPEDYARQLQMAAISRNTASVAQDFHNAGGGKMTEAQYANNQINNNLINETKNHKYKLATEFLNAFNHKSYNGICDMNFININRENLRPNEEETIVRQSISPPANQINILNESTNNWTHQNKSSRSKFGDSLKNDFQYYIEMVLKNTNHIESTQKLF